MKTSVCKYLLWALALLLLCQGAPLNARTREKKVRGAGTQKLARWQIKPGDYSGITPVENGLYAVVNDKRNAFELWHILQDSCSGRVLQVKQVRQVALLPDSGRMDLEAISWWPERKLLAVTSEQLQTCMTFTPDGEPAAERWTFDGEAGPQQIYGNYGFEALAYDTSQSCFWTCPENRLRTDGLPAGFRCRESARLPLYRLEKNGTVHRAAFYETDKPKAKHSGKAYCFGVSELCYLPHYGLLVLERELFVSKHYLHSWARHKIYRVDEAELNKANGHILQKHLVKAFCTRLNPLSYKLANYEGLCAGIRLKDGRQTLLLLNDAQSGAGNRFYRLKDYIRVLILPGLK